MGQPRQAASQAANMAGRELAAIEELMAWRAAQQQQQQQPPGDPSVSHSYSSGSSAVMRLVHLLNSPADSTSTSNAGSTSNTVLDQQAQQEICNVLADAMSAHDVEMAELEGQLAGSGGHWAGPRRYSDVRQAAGDAAEALRHKADLLHELSQRSTTLEKVGLPWECCSQRSA